MEIKNSTHSNEKILILKQSAKFKSYSKKNIFLSLTDEQILHSKMFR